MRMPGLRTLLPLVATAALGGCSTADLHYFTLAPSITEAGAKTEGLRVLVGPVTVPEAVDRPQMVVLMSTNQVWIDDLNRWVAPLGENIGDAVVGNLQALLATRDVAAGPLPAFDPSHRVTIDVQRFDSVPATSVTVDAIWSVIPTAPGATMRSGRTLAQEAVAGAGYDAIAAAHDRALAKVSTDIAAAIRASAATARRK